MQYLAEEVMAQDALWEDESWLRECECQANVLLGNPVSGHSCGCQFDM